MLGITQRELTPEEKADTEFFYEYLQNQMQTALEHTLTAANKDITRKIVLEAINKVYGTFEDHVQITISVQKNREVVASFAAKDALGEAWLREKGFIIDIAVPLGIFEFTVNITPEGKKKPE